MLLGWFTVTHQLISSSVVGVGSLIRGTQREYSSNPLKHSIVKRFLVFNGRYGHIFIP